MNFLYPTFLFALAAIAIPIIIHLFNFRRHKTVLFSNISFLKNIKKETKTKLQIKHLLILIARILAIASLVFAFAQPYIPIANNMREASEDVVAVYIDNSFSMDANGVKGNLFELAKSKLPEISKAFKPETKYFLLTNDFSQKFQQFVNRDQLLDFGNNLEIGPEVRKLSNIINRQNDFISRDNTFSNRRKTAIIISDFQKSSSDFQNIVQDSNINTLLIPLATQKTNNLFIDSCWFENPGRKFNQAEELFVRIVNKSAESYSNNPIKLIINDSLKAFADFNIDANSQTEIKLAYTNTQKGIISGRLEINDYPITYDNTFFFSYNIVEKLKILSISDKVHNKYVNALFENDESFIVNNSTVDKINFSLFSANNLVIISDVKELSTGFIQEITNYISNGGSVLFFPAIDGKIDSYNKMLSPMGTNIIADIDTQQTKISSVNFTHPVFSNAFSKIKENLDLPVVYSHFVFEQRTKTNDEEILTTMNKHSFLHQSHFGKGSLYISAVPLDDKSSNFSKHPIFLPAVYNMAFNSSDEKKLYYTIGEDKSLKVNDGDNSRASVYHIKDKTGGFDFIAEKQGMRNDITLYVDNAIRKSGNYFIAADNKIYTGVSFNYNRHESDMDYFTDSEIESQIEVNRLNGFEILKADNESFSSNLQDIKQGKQLWKIFIILVLLFILIEVAIIRFMK